MSSNAESQFPGTEKGGRLFQGSAPGNSPVDRVFLLNKPRRTCGLGAAGDSMELAYLGSLIDHIPKALLPRCRRLIKEAFLSRHQQGFEYQLTEFGQVHDYEVRVIPDGGDRMFVVISNTTRQKWAELWLSESEAHFRSIFESSPSAISVSNDGIHVFVNPAYLHLFGYEHDTELLGRPVLDLVAPTDRKTLQQVLQRRSIDDRGAASFEVLAVAKNGSRFPVHVSSSVYERLHRLYSVAHIQREIGPARQEPSLPDRPPQHLVRQVGAAAPIVEHAAPTDSYSLDSLSLRQREVLRLIAEGQSTKQIAATLGISFKTADTHRSNLMQKLNAHETATLVRLAVRFGLVSA